MIRTELSRDEDSAGNAWAVSFIKGSKHKLYEDRYRILSGNRVRKQSRGEIFAVFDGIGSAPLGMHAAQEMWDRLLDFLKEPGRHEATSGGFHKLLMEANLAIHDWGFIPGTDRPLGGCAGTVVWLAGRVLRVFHAGDTSGVLIRNGSPIPLTMEHQRDGAIFRYFGLGSSLRIDVNSFAVKEMDRILILSDGVTKIFHPTEAARLAEELSDNGRAVEELVRQSRVRGSRDDITALLVEIEDLEGM